MISVKERDFGATSEKDKFESKLKIETELANTHLVIEVV